MNRRDRLRAILGKQKGPVPAWLARLGAFVLLGLVIALSCATVAHLSS